MTVAGLEGKPLRIETRESMPPEFPFRWTEAIFAATASRPRWSISVRAPSITESIKVLASRRPEAAKLDPRRFIRNDFVKELDDGRL
jgi:hypothetical protein